MSHDEKANIEQIREMMGKRKQERDQLEHVLQTFTKRLYDGFQQAVKVLHEHSVEVDEIGEPRALKHPAGDWRTILQLFIEDWSIFIVPMLGAAWPNIRDEAMIPGSAFKEVCGRIGFFLSKSHEPEKERVAFYDIIVLLNSSWFAWGYGWPKQQADTEATNFESLALEMLASFTKDIHLTWASREETRFAETMDPRLRAYKFGLPGEE